MAKDQKTNRKEIQLLQTEAAWLQKGAFALRKAVGSQEKIAEGRSESPGPYVLTISGKKVELEAVEEALDARARELLETVREARRELR